MVGIESRKLVFVNNTGEEVKWVKFEMIGFDKMFHDIAPGKSRIWYLPKYRNIRRIKIKQETGGVQNIGAYKVKLNEGCKDIRINFIGDKVGTRVHYSISPSPQI